MGQSASVWLVLACALVAANLPFLTRRLLVVIPLHAEKNLAWHFAELVLMYFAVGAVALLLEQRLGDIAPARLGVLRCHRRYVYHLGFPGLCMALFAQAPQLIPFLNYDCRCCIALPC
jgi:Protein of unknown function (DUF2818)